jgi:hypothetical protein
VKLLAELKAVAEGRLAKFDAKRIIAAQFSDTIPISQPLGIKLLVAALVNEGCPHRPGFQQ